MKTSVEQFRATGNMAGKKRGGNKPRVRAPHTVGTIHASVASSPARKSVRQLASENEVSPSTAWRILRIDLRMHPYKIHVFQSLTTVCREKRTRFAEEFGNHLQQNPHTLEHIWFQIRVITSSGVIWRTKCSAVLPELKERMKGSCAQVTRGMLTRGVQNFVLRLQAVWESQGAHIEHVTHNATHMWNSNPCLLLWHYFHINKFAIANALLTLRWLMSYIYGAPILDVSRSHTTTQYSR